MAVSLAAACRSSSPPLPIAAATPVPSPAPSSPPPPPPPSSCPSAAGPLVSRPTSSFASLPTSSGSSAPRPAATAATSASPRSGPTTSPSRRPHSPPPPLPMPRWRSQSPLRQTSPRTVAIPVEADVATPVRGDGTSTHSQIPAADSKAAEIAALLSSDGSLAGERFGRAVTTDAITTPVVSTSAYWFKNSNELIDFKVCD